MLLGIVLHATVPYFSRMYGFESTWPADDDQSVLLALVFDFIHSWRMPVFFLLAGFFAHLVLDRRSTSMFVLDRLKRVALPLALFGAVMAVIIPPIWVYGWYGAVSFEVLRNVLADRQDLDSSGDLVAHLWFLYYLLLMYAALVVLRALGWPCRALRAVRPAWWPSACKRLGDAVYARMPLLLALGAVLLLVLRAGNEAKPIWPLNVPDVLYGCAVLLLRVWALRPAGAGRPAEGRRGAGGSVVDRHSDLLRPPGTARSHRRHDKVGRGCRVDRVPPGCSTLSSPASRRSCSASGSSASSSEFFNCPAGGSAGWRTRRTGYTSCTCRS